MQDFLYRIQFRTMLSIPFAPFKLNTKTKAQTHATGIEWSFTPTIYKSSSIISYAHDDSHKQKHKNWFGINNNLGVSIEKRNWLFLRKQIITNSFQKKKIIIKEKRNIFTTNIKITHVHIHSNCTGWFFIFVFRVSTAQKQTYAL